MVLLSTTVDYLLLDSNLYKMSFKQCERLVIMMTSGKLDKFRNIQSLHRISVIGMTQRGAIDLLVLKILNPKRWF